MVGRTLIAGCGYVGLALARLLAAPGVPGVAGVPGVKGAASADGEVFALRRHPEALGPLPPGVHPFAADLARAQTLANLPGELDAVVYAASASERSDAGYRAAYVDGPRHLLHALRRSGQRPRSFVFVSSTSVYEGAGLQAGLSGGWVDERTPVAPAHFPGRRLLEGEQLVRESDLPATIVRLGGIYGPGRERLLDSVRTGRARLRGPLPDGTPRWTNRIHRDDCAGVLAFVLASADREPPELLVAVDDEPTAYDELLAGLAELTGAPRPPLQEPDASQAESALRSNKRCRNALLRARGYTFRFPSWREGYTALLRGTDPRDPR